MLDGTWMLTPFPLHSALSPPGLHPAPDPWPPCMPQAGLRRAWLRRAQDGGPRRGPALLGQSVSGTQGVYSRFKDVWKVVCRERAPSISRAS